MKPCWPLPVLVLAISCVLPKFVAEACSVAMSYVRPTNYELVRMADAIVLAKAVSFEKRRGIPGGKLTGIFKFKILERIKGDFKVEFMDVEGDNDVRTWGDANDFGFTKADHGPCNPTDYNLEGNYVLFLEHWKGSWFVNGPPFTRVNVLVEGSGAPWARAVRRYAETAELNDYEKEKAALGDLRSRALRNDPDCPAALVRDIDRHFKMPTPGKSFADLRALYEQAKDTETREQVLWACVYGKKQEAKDLFRELLQSGAWLKSIYPVCSYVADVKLAGYHETFASAFRTHRTKHERGMMGVDERGMMLLALAGSAESTEQALMQKVLESVSKEEIRLLGPWFVEHPSQKSINRLTKLARQDYAEEFELTLLLAAMADTNVLNWANQFVKQASPRDWVGYYVFACSPLPEADALARQVIARGDSGGLVALIQGYSDSKRGDRLDRVKDAMALKTKSRKLIFWLRRTLGSWAHDGDKLAESLLNQLPVVESER